MLRALDRDGLQGENHSDTGWYREDFQRRMADKDTISCQLFGGTQY